MCHFQNWQEGLGKWYVAECFLSQGQNNTNMDIERLKVMSSMIENNKNESMQMVDPGRSMQRFLLLMYSSTNTYFSKPKIIDFYVVEARIE